jgi:hypothetical protein
MGRSWPVLRYHPSVNSVTELCMYVSLCVCVFMYVCMYVCMYVFVCMYVCM